MVGAVAANLHEGSRSEILADYLFSSWGTVTPVRRQDDYGVDLYCTLTERVGRRARVRDHFTVQVKSSEDPWVLKNRASVEWLVDHPTPLFLCAVNKKDTRVRVYHTFVRFYVWAMGKLPATLELMPEPRGLGRFVQWAGGSKLSLSAPIIEADLGDLCDDERMEKLQNVFKVWVGFDRENCDLVRQGLLRFRMPDLYTTNELPTVLGEYGYAQPPIEFIRRGVSRLAEAAECIGGQVAEDDPELALLAALLIDRLKEKHAGAFNEAHFGREKRVPGHLGAFVTGRLNKGQPPGCYLYAGLDAIKAQIANEPLIEAYLAGDVHPRPPRPGRVGRQRRRRVPENAGAELKPGRGSYRKKKPRRAGRG